MEVFVFNQIPNEEKMQSICWQAWFGETSVANKSQISMLV